MNYFCDNPKCQHHIQVTPNIRHYMDTYDKGRLERHRYTIKRIMGVKVIWLCEQCHNTCNYQGGA